MYAIRSYYVLIWHRHFEMSLQKIRLWIWFSLISLALLVIYFLTPASTAVDRVALYMIPLQLAVFPYVPEVYGTRHGRNTVFTAAVLIYYAAVLFVWLNFATHSKYWVPYRNWLFM